MGVNNFFKYIIITKTNKKKNKIVHLTRSLLTNVLYFLRREWYGRITDLLTTPGIMWKNEDTLIYTSLRLSAFLHFLDTLLD